MRADDGGTIDDLIVYRLGAERFMLCVNASNIEADWEWLPASTIDGADFRDVSDGTALVAMQGPKAIAILRDLAAFPIDAVRRFRVADGEVAGVRWLVGAHRLYGRRRLRVVRRAPTMRARLFEAIMAAGRSDGLKPCGLGARDTLRLEAGLPLYGHELDRETSPLEAGLGTFVKFGRGFVGERRSTRCSARMA